MFRPPADRGQQSHSPEDGESAGGGGGSSCSRCPSNKPTSAPFQSEAEPRAVPRCTYNPGRALAGYRSRAMETEVHVPVGAPAVLKFAIYVDENDVIPGALALVGKLRPKWDVSQVKTKLFTDGITNKLVGCYLGNQMEDVVLVRVYGNKTELFVDRDNELKSFQVLQANGCAPKLYCTFLNGLCYEFMHGTALCPQSVREPTLFRLIATELARIHCIHAHNGCIPKPNLWVKMRKYMALISSEFTPEAKNTRIQKKVPPLETLEKEMVWMKKYLSELNSPTVLCHNDLLCKNIIYNEKEGWVKFIDYEYSGYNYQAFDIGNHFNEFAGVNEVDYSLYPDQSLQFQWLRTYLEACKRFTKKGGEVTDNEVQTLYVQVNKFSLASHFFWGFWALIQAKYSTIEFDFLGYSVLRFNQYFKMKPQVIVLQTPA
ncbi:ethanolamine kinase 1-like [Chiloscyllium plagiosum]|uniref:ethanolamine kinase 1-like n=1 Tax=Chiloscyllium plagiosum TaxID=36176 RepID=UPI001CB7C24D|nr:ethanolamine kinase 1-like [Chiloscyllium plagiosum]